MQMLLTTLCTRQHSVASDKCMPTHMLATAHTKLLKKTVDFHCNFVNNANVIATIAHAQHSVAIDKLMQTVSSAQNIAKNNWNSFSFFEYQCSSAYIEQNCQNLACLHFGKK